jgi:radical SAM superfamily enzyme YgiQ (UPF0313 family)
MRTRRRWMKHNVSVRDKAVVLINTNWMQPVVAPIGLDYVGTALQNHGYDVELLDLAFAADRIRTTEKCLSATQPVAIGVTVRNTDDCYFVSQDSFLPEIKELVRFIGERTDAPVILGGCGFSILPVPLLEYCGCDLGIQGDGEVAFLELLDALHTDTDYTSIPGLVYRTEKGWRVNPAAGLPVAESTGEKRSVVDNPRYLAEGGMGNIETKRGCDRGCIYCADPIAKGRRIRVRDPRAVVDELETLLNQGVDVLHLCDSEFNIPMRHATAVCEEIVGRNLGDRVRWYAYMSPTPFTGEFASLLKRAGCAGINFGIDSGNDAMLKRLGRDFTARDIVNTAGICRECGITFMFDLLLGGPGESRETVMETVELMRRCEPDRVGAAVGVRVYPGTPLARLVASEGAPERNPNLRGSTADNETFLEPVFYVSEQLGPDPVAVVSDFIGNDNRFFTASPESVQQNYNYNENQELVEAIRKGYRGAFWDILRRLAQD